jgi:hypothetical protein
MGIIKAAERQKRAMYVADMANDKEQRTQNAFAELDKMLPLLVNDLVESAKRWHETTGQASVATARIPGRLYPLKASEKAREMIMNAMLAVEPHTADVQIIDDDHHGVSWTLKVYVRFKPALT